MAPEEKTTPKNRLTLDLRIVVVILLLIIGGMLAVWKPWDSTTSDDRTISVTGEATVSAEPDEYVFYPAYEFTNADQAVAIDELTKKSDGIVDRLKQLGVADRQIKTNASGNNYRIIREPDSDESTYSLSLTVTVDNKELAQKVQDYLITTDPSGAITPNPTFSDAKRKELENKARDEATKDARAKAEQSAQNLGFGIGKVKSVSDGSGFGVFPVGRAEDTTSAQEPASQLTIQPGENDLDYSVTIVYYLK